LRDGYAGFNIKIRVERRNKMHKWKNLKVIHGCLIVFSVATIIGISFGFAKYYGFLVVLDRSICAWDSAILVFSATYLGLKATLGKKFDI
jgi:hypothetical protein